MLVVRQLIISGDRLSVVADFNLSLESTDTI